MEVEQTNFMTPLIITVQLYYWLSKNPSVKIWSNELLTIVVCKFKGKSNEGILWKLRKRKILRLYSIVHVALETTKTFNFTCQSKSFISIFFTCQVLACELQSFSCHDLTNDIYLQTANCKTVLSHLKGLIPLPDVIQPSYEMTPGFKPFPVLRIVCYFTSTSLIRGSYWVYGSAFGRVQVR